MKKILVVFIIVIAFILASTMVTLAEKGGKGKGSPVSKAAHQAQGEGLKGQDLSEKVHEAIQERKESKEEEEIKEEKEETDSDEKAEKHKKSKQQKKSHKHQSKEKTKKKAK